MELRGYQSADPPRDEADGNTARALRFTPLPRLPILRAMKRMETPPFFPEHFPERLPILRAMKRMETAAAALSHPPKRSADPPRDEADGNGADRDAAENSSLPILRAMKRMETLQLGLRWANRSADPPRDEADGNASAHLRERRDRLPILRAMKRMETLLRQFAVFGIGLPILRAMKRMETKRDGLREARHRLPILRAMKRMETSAPPYWWQKWPSADPPRDEADGNSARAERSAKKVCRSSAR